VTDYSWTEIAIMLLIMAGVVFAAWRGGAANPEPTGQLSRRVGRVESEIKEVRTELRGVGKRQDELEERLDRALAKIDQLPTRADFENLKELMAKDARLAEKTWDAVERIEGFFLEKGVKGR